MMENNSWLCILRTLRLGIYFIWLEKKIKILFSKHDRHQVNIQFSIIHIVSIKLLIKNMKYFRILYGKKNNNKDSV